MLNLQESIWVVYTVIFFVLAVILLGRIRSSWLLVPFILFAILADTELILKLVQGHPDEDNALDTATRSSTIHRLPILSVLLFDGIIISQLVFINHLAIAFSQRTRWASLRYFEPSEKSLIEPNMSVITKDDLTPSPVRPWVYWLNLVIVFLYVVITVVYLGFEILERTADISYALVVPICITGMAVLAVTNALVVWGSNQFRSARHIRVLRQNHRNLSYLLLSPILFSVTLTTTATLSWVIYFAAFVNVTSDTPALLPITSTVWFILEGLLIYLPLFGILLMCFFVQKLDLLCIYQPKLSPSSSLTARKPVMTTPRKDSIQKDGEDGFVRLSLENNFPLSVPPAAAPHHHGMRT
ncbi:hypothetical protein J3Q64DRAFT_1711053 [Phycomyces blakesleeanus]|uniref:Uncharacterized protein n=1 Tax=Phycomyces blakesleeanus TaxID=4837 RepID=A0ABR3BFX6_PHYBL